MKKLILPLFFMMLFCIPSLQADHLSGSLQLTARMNGANEVPAVATNAEGLGIFTIDASKKNIAINISVSNLSGPITGIHIHEGTVGTNGGVVHDLSSFINGNRIQTTLRNVTDLDKFLSGVYYLNVHTDMNPGGEIRAQILIETDFRYAASLDGNQEVPAVTTNGFGLGVFNLSKSGYKLEIKAVVSGLSGVITGAHLHEGAFGVNGGVVEDLTMAISGNVITATVDPTAYLTALRSGNIYLNIHTAANPGGEIRGQVLLDNVLFFDAFLNGSQEIPSVSTSAQGVASFSVSNDLTTLTYDVVVDGLSGAITGAHLHAGGAGSNGGVLIDLTGDIDGNRISGNMNGLSVQLLNRMLSGGIYLNVHTDANPLGEIRGQVYKLSREGYSYDFSGGQEVGPTDSPGTGAGMVTIDRDQTNAHFMMVVSGLSTAIDAAHFHNAFPGENGGVIYNLSSFFNTVGGAYGYWTEQDATTPFANSLMFRQNTVYVNIHTTNFPSGEIRGNVSRGRDFFANLPIDPRFSNDLLIATKLTGGASVPIVITDGVGVTSFAINDTRDEIEVNVSVHNLTGPITGIHVHEGAPDENGPVVFDLSPGIIGNRIKMTWTGFSTDQLASLLSGDYYLNVHTDANPGGEIRGQLRLETDPTYRANLDGAQEVPTVATDAFGLGIFNYTNVVNQLEINVLVRGLSGPITGAHLHNAAPGMNGGVVEDLTGFVRGNRIQGIVFPNGYLEALQKGEIYINVHTDTNPGGEIRGQLNLDNNLTFDTWLSGAQEVPAATNVAHGFAAISLSPTFDELSYRIIVNNLSGDIASSHLHNAALGQNGGVLLDLSSGINGNEIEGSATDAAITTGLIDALLTGNIYINVHTAGFPGGEIRGQVYRLARDGYGYDLCTEQETMMVDAPIATGGGMASIDRHNSNAHVMVVTSGLTGTLMGVHIHQATAGNDGGVLVDLSDLFSDGSIFTYLSSDDFNRAIANDIKNANAYLNLHTEAHPAGELRGQIIKDLTCSLPVSTKDLPTIFQELTLAPVPVQTTLLVQYSLETTTTVTASVIDMLGRTIWTQTFSNTLAGEHNFSIESGAFTSGLYQLILDDGQQLIRKSFIKEE